MPSNNSNFCSLGRDGYKLHKKCVSPELELLIKKDLVIHPESIMDNQELSSYKIYNECKKYYYFPMFWALANIDIEPHVDFSNVKSKKYCRPEFIFLKQLYDNQIPMVEPLLDHYVDFKTGKPKPYGSSILNIDTGLGKTMIALFVTVFLQQKTIISCHTDEIACQWEGEINKIIKGAKIQRFESGTTIEKDTNIVIVLVQTMMRKNYSETFKDYNFTIYDEAHHYASAVFSQSLLFINTPYKLALSATIERRDNLQRVVMYFLGDIGYRKIEELDQHVRLKIYRFLTKDKNFKVLQYGKNIRYSEMMNRLCIITPRNKMICDIIHEHLQNEPTRQILVISHRLDHLDLLKEMLVENYGYGKKEIGKYIGGMNKKKNEKKKLKIRKKRIILGIYNIMQEGVNIPTLDTVILATPQNRIFQSCGRIFRKLKEFYDNIPTIIDIADQLSIYINMERARLLQYKEKYMKYDTNTISYYSCNHMKKYLIEHETDLSPNEVVTHAAKPKVTKDNCISMFDDSDSDDD